MRGFHRAASWWLGPAVFTVVGAFAACEGAQGDNASMAPSTEAGPDNATDAVILIFDDANGARDSSTVGSDANAPDAAGVDAGLQPVVECGDRSGDAARNDAEANSGECDMPPSRCADQRWLVFYENGACVDGRCRWQERFYQCELACDANGCISNRTAPAAP